MDSRTGDLYPSKLDALQAGVPEEALVEIWGEITAVRAVSGAVKAQAKARRQAQRKSRKKNR